MLESGRCDAYTNERGGLAASRLGLGQPDDYIILPEIISKEPLGPIVRQNDPKFRDVAAWTLHALIAAEEFGNTQENAAALAESSDDPENPRPPGNRTSGGEGKE